MDISAALREQFIRWALRVKPPEASPITLGQRRVYVLPTRTGIGYAAALLTMLIGSINYNLSLGYALTFLLGGLGVVAILHTFRNLVRLKVSRGKTAPAFAGEHAAFHLVLASDIERRALRLWLPDGESTTVDIAARDSADACLRLPTAQRGWLTLPRVGIETTWPFGLIRAGASNLLKVQNGSQIVGIPSGSLSFFGKAGGSGLIGAKEVESESAQEGEVERGVTQTNRAGILAESHIEAPVQSVLNPPVGTHGMKNALAIGRQRTDHEASFRFHLAGNLACRFDAGHRRQFRPACLQAKEFEPVEMIHGDTAPGLNATMPLIQGLMYRYFPLRVARRIECTEEVA
jgi:hypothetical protein